MSEAVQGPKAEADAIDASRARALAAAAEAAAKQEQKPPPPPSSSGGDAGGAPPPQIVTPEALLKFVVRFNAAGAVVAKKSKKTFEPIADEEATLWAELAAPCLDELRGAGEIPYLGTLLRWGAFLTVSGFVFVPAAISALPDPPTKPKPPPGGSHATPEETVRRSTDIDVEGKTVR